MIPTITYETLGSSRAVVIDHPRFKSEIWWHPLRTLAKPMIHEWGPAWHELDLNKFTIDFSRQCDYDQA